MSIARPVAVIAGVGFLGMRLARLLLDQGFLVIGLSQSGASAGLSHVTKNLKMARADISLPSGLSSLPTEAIRPRILIHCASSKGGGPEGYERVYLQGAKNLLSKCDPERFIFTGSTSVYAQKSGDWVDEESPTEPQTETGKILLEAERVVTASGGIVARCAGIYGPGRSVYLRKLSEGTAAIDSKGERFVNQIHVEDAAAALLHLAGLEVFSSIYNIADSTPMKLMDVYKVAAEALKLPLPPFTDDPVTRKRGDTNKQISNVRIRASGWEPKFGSYADWLACDLELQNHNSDTSGSGDPGVSPL
jgi:nucleoside-diphosphate-sugar epimerase